MNELCYTANQIKVVKACIVAMMGVSIFQAFTIQRLNRISNRGRTRFNQLHDAAEYLLEVINDNDIELTEFDLIALTSIIEGDK